MKNINDVSTKQMCDQLGGTHRVDSQGNHYCLNVMSDISTQCKHYIFNNNQPMCIDKYI